MQENNEKQKQVSVLWETCWLLDNHNTDRETTWSKMEKANTKDLFVWSLQNGVQIKGLTMKNFPCSGRGVMTTRFVNKNDLIISIPRDFLITFDTVLSYLKKSKCAKTLVVSSKLTAKDLFLLFLVLERRNNNTSRYTSKYRIYVNSVPDVYTTPCYIPQNEIELLPQFLKEEVEDQLSKINRHYTRLMNNKKIICDCTLLNCEQNICYEDVKWAWNIINTRSVYFSSKHLNCEQDAVLGVREVNFALAPLLDMLNHQSSAQVHTL